VISNADATLTYTKLLNCDTDEHKAVNNLIVSPSAFITYLGLRNKLNITPAHFVTWFFSTYDIEKSFTRHLNNFKLKDLNLDYLLISFPTLIDPSLTCKDKSIIGLLIGTKYLSPELWHKHKEAISQKMIDKLCFLLPEINKQIELKVIAGPSTLERYTSNRKGALFGWASLPTQIDRNLFPSMTSVENLYLTGHWVTNGAGQGGVSGSAFCGKATSRIVLKKFSSRILL